MAVFDTQAVKAEEVYYRLSDYRVSLGCDEYGDPYPGSAPAIRTETFQVLRHTPKGVWIRYYDRYGWSEKGERFILHSAVKKFAHPTIEEAKQSFLARKNRQKRILQNQLKHVEEAEVLCQKVTKPGSVEGPRVRLL